MLAVIRYSSNVIHSVRSRTSFPLLFKRARGTQARYPTMATTCVSFVDGSDVIVFAPERSPTAVQSAVSPYLRSDEF